MSKDNRLISTAIQNSAISTQEVADILNVSHPFLMKLLEQGKIAHIKVGNHHRICYQDLIQYKEQRDIERKQGLRELTQFLQDEGFYEA